MTHGSTGPARAAGHHHRRDTRGISCPAAHVHSSEEQRCGEQRALAENRHTHRLETALARRAEPVTVRDSRDAVAALVHGYVAAVAVQHLVGGLRPSPLARPHTRSGLGPGAMRCAAVKKRVFGRTRSRPGRSCRRRPRSRQQPALP